MNNIEYSSELLQQFIKVLEYSQEVSCDYDTIKEMFDTWASNKAHLYKAFGNKMIYVIDDNITVKLEKEEKEKLVDDFISSHFISEEFSDFLRDNKKGFFKNKVVDNQHFPKVPIGMKLAKAFKYFIANKDTLDEMQQEASQIIQKDGMTGSLCLSIHPLDYLSVSENRANWRSCHALNGEYRAGNLSYFQDEVTLVVYLKSADGEVYSLPHFPKDVLWNNKKWRALYYLEPSGAYVFCGREYPFACRNLMNRAAEEMLKLGLLTIKKGLWNCPSRGIPSVKLRGWVNESIDFVQWKDDSCTYFSKPYWINKYNKTIVCLEDIVRDYDEYYATHYNDVLKSTCSRPLINYPIYKDEQFNSISFNLLDYPITVGHSVKCIACGMEEIESENGMVCESCCGDPPIYCDDCGEPCDADEVYCMENGDYVCPSCIENDPDKYLVCEYCGNVVFRDNPQVIEEYCCLLCKERSDGTR